MTNKITDNPILLYDEMRKIHKNVYEPCDLYEQNRRNVSEYINNLRMPGYPDDEVVIDDNMVQNTHGKASIANNVVDFTHMAENNNANWQKLNTQFLHYHQSLTIYEIINGLAANNYLSFASGMGDIKNKRVVDVGAGTGHIYCSFFRYPETLEYYLLDPNLRLLHDMFLKMFPKLAVNKLAHILSYAENIPLKSDFADVVISIAAIDHYKDYQQFIAEAYRILKKDGIVFISSHLDIKHTKRQQKLNSKGNIVRFLERLTRYIYLRQYKVGKDDHTFHFEDTSLIVECLKNSGFEIIEDVVYDTNFYIKAKK